MPNGVIGILIAVLVVVGIAVGAGYYAISSGMVGSYETPTQADATQVDTSQSPAEQQKMMQITSFEECAAAGNPIMESYPRQCRTPEGDIFVEDIETPVESVEESGTPIEGSSYTVEEFEAKPTLCEKDSDCKIIPITCNSCDCGRAVNSWIEPYQCTAEDKADPCPLALDCKPSKAVCEAGVCKKVDV